MTRQLSGPSLAPPMELDLDAFLRSHSAAASDNDDGDGEDHRTVDEILLNISDSDSDSPPPHPHHHTDKNDDVSVCTPKTLPALTLSNSQSDDDIRRSESKLASINRIKSGEFFTPSVDSGSSGRNSLPPLLIGGARSNVKPGAALAAAAAASRPIPTRHLAAIKSRNTSASLHSSEEELGGDSKNGSESEVVSEAGFDAEEVGINQLDEKKEEVVEENLNCSSAEEEEGERKSEILRNNERMTEVTLEEEVELIAEENEVIGDDSNGVLSGSNELVIFDHLNDEKELTSGKAFASPVSDDGNDQNECNVVDANGDVTSEVMNVDDSIQDDMEKKVESTSEVKESIAQENVVSESNEGAVNVVGDDMSAPSDSVDLGEEIILRWESLKGGGRNTGKKSRSSKKPLELAEELEKKHAFTGLHWEEGAAAQPMRLEGVRKASTELGYFDIDTHNTITRTISSQAFRRDHGSPQVVAVHLNFIALGMSKGVIAIWPTRYSPHHADNIDAKMLMLGLQGDRSHAAVTSMCFHQQGDLLFAGYGDGHITIWDVQRASAVKVLPGEHVAPVVHMIYLGQESQQVTRQFTIVSGDSSGVVKSFRFTMIPWLNKISSVKMTPLLDEKTSTVVCASPLISGEGYGGVLMSSQGHAAVSTTGIGSVMGGVVGGDGGLKSSEGFSLVEEGVVIFVTHQSALVAKISIPVQVYAQLPKPEGVREGSMPYAAWKCMAQSHGTSTGHKSEVGSEIVSLLAIAWDRKIQVAKFVKSELKVYRKWSIENSAIGVAWLDEEMLVVFTSAGHLCLFAKDGTMIHQTSFALDGSRVDDLIAYHTQFTNIFGNPEKSYHNYVAVRGATVYILGPMHLLVSRLLPWKERIEVLRRAGDWMGALNMAMTIYDGQAHGVIDLPKALDDLQKAIMPYLLELILSYVDEVFSYISVAFCNQIERLDQLDDSKNISSSVHMEIKEQFTRVGGVAVEFCIHIKKTDILFDDILSRFVSVQQRETFLEILEPYILKDMLGSLPPEIMQALVEHYSMKGWLQRVEQCVLHMDISSLDFNQVVRLCREHRLYGALIYLFNKGLNDFKAPLEELLIVLQNSRRDTAAAIGYRMLVYLKYCFTGLAFPPGHGTLASTRLPSLRTELIQFLLEDSNAPKPGLVTTSSSTGVYPNLYHLLEFDTEATLDVLRCAFVEAVSKQDSLCDSTDSDVERVRGPDLVTSENQHLIQEIVNVLAAAIEMTPYPVSGSTAGDVVDLAEIWPSKRDSDHIFDFIAFYVSCERVRISKGILSQILDYLTSEVNFPPNVLGHCVNNSRRREKQMLSLLEVVPETDWDASHFLHLCEKAQFYQVCGFIYVIRHQYLSALDSYMKDLEEPVLAFSFIDATLLQLKSKEYEMFRSAVISRIADLVKLNREGTFLLIVDHFRGESQHILSELQSHPESLFLYLKTVLEVHSTCTLNFSVLRKDDVDFSRGIRGRDRLESVEFFLKKISDFPKLLHSNPVDLTDDLIELYFELLCQYDRNSVLRFLETFESYRLEHCLRLCQEYGIIDAAAFLLERVGDVAGALVLTLSGLDHKFIMLEAAVENVLSDAGVEHLSCALKKPVVNDIFNIVHACISLCQRNSPRLDPDESESLWFQFLDTFCEPLMDSNAEGMSFCRENRVAVFEDTFGRQHIQEPLKIRWKISKSHKGAHILRKLFSMFIKEIVEGMVGYVGLPAIMLKLLSDNGSQEFGDFKLTILGMLGTYDFERKILDTARSLIEDDIFYNMSLLKKGASHGYAPRSLLCCICNCLLTKNSSGSGIRVFNCGHAAHVHCESQENETSEKHSFVGCPICAPKKKVHRSRSKSVLAENGLLSKPVEKAQLVHGNTTLHPHESDAFDNSYGFHPIPRFEMLANLQKDKRIIQIETMPQLRLAPPAVYHEKVKKRTDLPTGESSSGAGKVEKASKSRQFRELKAKGSSIRLPLKTNIFGKEKISKR